MVPWYCTWWSSSSSSSSSKCTHDILVFLHLYFRCKSNFVEPIRRHLLRVTSVHLFEKALTIGVSRGLNSSSASSRDDAELSRRLNRTTRTTIPLRIFFRRRLRSGDYNSTTTNNGMVVPSNAEATPTGATLQKHPNQRRRWL